MYKIITLFFISTIYLFSNPIKFKEEKFINALQTSVYKNGTLFIKDETIELSYLKKDKYLIFNKDNIIEKNENEEKVLNYEDNLELTIFSKLIKSIYKNQTEELKEYFEIKREKETVLLIPNDYISNVIDKIEYKKNNSQLDFLKIYFLNEDWIKIIENN